MEVCETVKSDQGDKDKKKLIKAKRIKKLVAEENLASGTDLISPKSVLTVNMSSIKPS